MGGVALKNPFEILGLVQTASDEQVKQAYKELARKYSEDKYNNGPLSGIAQKKMQEINEAYDSIILNRGSAFGATDTGRQSDTGDWNNNYHQGRQAHSEFNDIRVTIQNGRIDDAETLLDGIPPSVRSAEWYYLKGTVQYRRGWLEEAVKNFQTACNMDPGNKEYRDALNGMNKSRSGGYRADRSGNSGCSGCDLCTGLLCADCCCECFGGDCIPCC
jgi:curved DNA-binding protein CbpA